MTLVTAIGVGWILTAAFIGLARARGWGKAIRSDGPEAHHDKAGTPTMGGIPLLIAAAAVWAVTGPHHGPALAVAALTAASAGHGLIDDLLALRSRRQERRDSTTGLLARYRLLVQTGMAAAFAVYAVAQGFGPLGQQLLDTVFLTAVVVGSINAFNFTDGLDGLAAGVTAIILLSLLTAPLALPLLGALLAFLWFNGHPARVFMGGVGAEALGAAVAAMAIVEGMVWQLPIIAIIPVLEVLSVIVQVVYFRVSGGRRLLRMSPLHHHFELGGWPEQRVVHRFWLITAIGVAVSWGLARVAS